MSYLHISNLYQEKTILLFKEVYAMEKIHGTSAHVLYENGRLTFSPGSVKHVTFVALFDQDDLLKRFQQLGHEKVVVYGEAYGGSQQGMKDVYGDKLKFVVFDVKIHDLWLDVPNMTEVAHDILGLDVVPWEKVSTDLAALDAVRDKPSEQAKKNGILGDKPREGVVLRPLIELRPNNDDRVIVKYKADAFKERVREPKISDEKLALMTEARAIADEWVTEMRLLHVLDKLPQDLGLKDTPLVIRAMVDDVMREAAGEIVDTPEVRRAIGTAAAKRFHTRVTKV